MLKHLAIIPDGNRRWAKKNKVSLKRGYVQGIERMGDLLKWCREENIRMLTIWGFSMENFARTKNEVRSLFGLFSQRLDEALKEDEYHKNRVRVRFFGRRDQFPKHIQQKIAELEEQTAHYNRFYLNLFFGYGGRVEIVDACQAIVDKARQGTVKKVTETMFASQLYTTGMPDPDLIIRTSNETRLSGFLPWQGAYSELYFSKKLWPDFTRRDLKAALRDYARRQRRYGR